MPITKKQILVALIVIVILGVAIGILSSILGIGVRYNY